MTRTAALVLVVFALFQAPWFILPKNGSPMGVAYRNRERIQAFENYFEHPSPANKDCLDAELSLLARHLERRDLLICATLVAVDGIVGSWIVLSWRKEAQWRAKGGSPKNP